MNRRWTSTHATPPVATAFPLRRPLVRPTPVHTSFAPLPIDGRLVRRTARLAIGSAICALVGHDWTCRVSRRLVWNPQAGDFTVIDQRDPERHRICQRCEIEHTRHLYGRWTDRTKETR